MLRKSAFFRWCAVPLAGVAGFVVAAGFGSGSGGVRTGVDSKADKSLPVKVSGPVAGAVLDEDAARARTPEFAEIGRWVARLAKCGVGDLPGVLTEVLALPDGEEKIRALRLLCARWAEVDAAGGFERLMALKIPDGNAAEGRPDMNSAERQARRFLLTEWARRDPAAAFAAGSRLEGEEKRWAMEAVGGGLLDDGPQAFWAWFELARAPVPLVFSEKWRPVLQEHLAEWLAVAEGSLKETEESMPYRSQFLQNMAKILTEQDPAKATDWAKSLPLEFRRGPMLSVLKTLADSSPEKVADYPELLAAADSDKLQIHELIGLAAKNMAEKDLTGAVRWLADHSSNRELYPAAAAVGDRLGEAVSEGKMTPEQAIAAARTTGELAQSLIERLYPDLPAAMLGKLATFQEAAGAESFRLIPTMAAWAAKDPEAAMRFAGSLEDGKQRLLVYANYLESAGGGLSDLLSGRTGTALEKIPEASRASAVWAFLEQHPQGENGFSGKAFADTVAALPESFEKTTAMERMLKTWGGSDPHSAVAWAASLPEAEGKVMSGEALVSAVEGWAKADAWGASQWVNAQPPGANRDAAAQALALTLAGTEPESAWVWTLNVQDAGRRRFAMEQVLREWTTLSPEAAGKAFDQVSPSLPDADRAELGKILTRSSTSQRAK